MNTLVTISDGKPTTTSLLVAGKFGKQHKHVLDSINSLIHSAENSAQFYYTGTYTDSTGRTLPMYYMDRDGFSLLVMGFTGKQALQFKFDFITQFNAMETRLREMQSSAPNVAAISRKELAQMLLASEEEKERLEARTRLLEQTNQHQEQELSKAAPKVQYYDKVMDSTALVTVNRIALDLGISARRLNQLLCEKRIQYRQGECFMLYTPYRDKGYARIVPIPYLDSEMKPRTRDHLYWTEKGRQFIRQVLNT